ncbi:hypothetical protein GI584_06445 [Gracilibacillus salitolerans]|uniref:STAS domain-containing protein n=1 Tax=Gracilibacillus salitolerans TaxID=2663022 RepID=A0A5Q2TFU8_9BACI|nr:hypothetical protein [Gracilibacillus salitolerans]QGH33679.1 hypothetical protein GI584_06445 [Gracilibacillus salitolerans]
MAKIENMTDNGGYVIDVKVTSKTVYMNVVGAFTPDQADKFHQDYEKQIGSISTIDYVLQVDCKDMKVINQEMTPKLTQSFELYKKSGFKKIEFLINNNVVIKMQLNRIAKTVDLPNYEIIGA